jgi:hypothetical protein
MRSIVDDTAGRPAHRTFSELMDFSARVFREEDYRMLAKQAEAHRAAANASDLPAVRAHRTALADNIDDILAAHRERTAPVR